MSPATSTKSRERSILANMAYITYTELAEEQKKPLEYKIEKAIEAIGQGFAVCKHRAALAFSGGKDSTVLWHLIRTHFPAKAETMAIIYGNTGVEYPESLKFARKLGAEWGGENFHEVRPLPLEKDGLKYSAQREVFEWLIETGKIDEVLKADGKLKNTETLMRVCPDEMLEKFYANSQVWKAGTPKHYAWCVDQYGYPLLGKAFSKLTAHRINIDCFLRFSQSESQDKKLLEYYRILKQVKISQACCHFLKKEPSEAKQAELKVDVIFKGLMAAESRSRAQNFLSRGYLFKSRRKYLGKDPFYHCNPLQIWTDDDIWEYIHRFDVPYSDLYHCGYLDAEGNLRCIPRNGCMPCGTDLLFRNNHLSVLRRTHPKAWQAFMRQGLGAEIRKLQQAKRKGQLSIFDAFDISELIEMQPCFFDDIREITLFDDTFYSDEYDSEV